MAKQIKLNHYIDLQEARDSHKVVLDIRATLEERLALAKRCGILEVKDLDAHLILSQGSRPDLFRIEGQLRAQVVQACSVNNTPIDETIDESFDEVLTTDPKALEPEEETDDSPDQPVDLLENDRADLGEIIAQWLAVSLNPYPRSDAPEFAHIEDLENENGAKTHNPFTVLEKLKK